MAPEIFAARLSVASECCRFDMSRTSGSNLIVKNSTKGMGSWCIRSTGFSGYQAPGCFPGCRPLVCFQLVPKAE